MTANTCPVCGKDVMPYRRFIREAEPWKISPCGSCGAKLRRSRNVFLFLLLMMFPLAAIIAPLFLWLAKIQTAYWIILVVTLFLVVASTILVNYLAWRLVGWVTVDEKHKR
jgi:uncharacterized protein (DUF983 family)